MISLIDILYNSLLFAPFYILLIYYFLYGKKFYFILLSLNSIFIANKIMYLTGTYNSSISYVFTDVLIIDAFVYLFLKDKAKGRYLNVLKKNFIAKFIADFIFIIVINLYNGSQSYDFSVTIIMILLLFTIFFMFVTIIKTLKDKRLFYSMFLFISFLYISHFLLFSSYITLYKSINIISFCILSLLYFFLFFIEKEKTSKRIKGLNSRLDIVNIFVEILSKVSKNPVVGSENISKPIKKLNQEILHIITTAFGWTSGAVYLIENNDSKNDFFVYNGSYGDFKPLDISSSTVMSIMRSEGKLNQLETKKFKVNDEHELLGNCYSIFVTNKLMKLIKYDRSSQKSTMSSLGLTDYTSSIAVVPLISENKIFGLIVFQDKKIGDYKVENFDYERISELYSMILNNILNSVSLYKEHEKTKIVKQELDIAGNIQQTLLPNKIPEINGININGFMKAARDIGGDYYDFIKINDDKVAILIGDISGKGLPAGMLMLVMRTIMHTIIKTIYNPKEVISYLSGVISEYLDKGKFITFLYLIWDNKEKKLSYASCGHEHIIHYKQKTKELTITKSGGIALGILPDMDDFIEEKSIYLEDGDIIALYTDGITEARNEKGDFYSLERFSTQLKKKINTHKGLNDFSIDILKKEIIDDVLNFSKDLDSQYDDMTLVLIERSDENNGKI